MKINDALPSDVHVIDITKAPPKFHARHHAVSRGYIYVISKRRTALGKRYVWWIKDDLDTSRMKQACAVFEGFHDFRSFTADDPEEKSTTVELEECSLTQIGSLLVIRIRGSHFLWKMVRQMVGMIVDCGRGGMDPGKLRELLTSASVLPAQRTAPPSGLFLDHVRYSKTEPVPPIQPPIVIS
jgi:tRNA pseudouridine38-40 synthase